MLALTCKNCGVGFTTYDERRSFCSKSCYIAYKVAHPDEYGGKTNLYTCQYCGAPVKRKPSEVINGNIYCSRSCSNKAQSQALKDHPELRHSKGAEVTCQNCGKPFYIKPHRAKAAKFCSRQCFHAYRFGKSSKGNGLDTAGSNNPNFKDTSNHTTARKIAIKAYGKACMVCGWDITCDVHHITRRKLGGNAPDNLVVLCPNHHRMAHLNLISQSELRALVQNAIAQSPDHQGRLRLPES